MSRRVNCLILFLSSAVVLSANVAGAINIASNQGTSQDGFAYNFSFVTTPQSDAFEVIATVTTNSPGTHSTEVLVQFDLSSIGLSPAQVTSATLNMYVMDVTEGGVNGFGVNPDASNPVQVDAHLLGAAWDRDTLVWANKPAPGAVVNSQVINSVGHWVAFPVLSVVQGWLANPASNFGLLLRETAPVGGPGNYRVAAFASGYGDFAQNAPYLTVVPEPASWLLVLAAAPALACLRAARRRRAG